MSPPGEQSVIDFMELHLRSLYTHDALGRITGTREPESRRCARFHLGRTRLGNLWRFRDDLLAEDVGSLARLAGKEAALGRPEALARDERPPPPERLEPMRRVLQGRAPIEFEWAGPAFRFPDDLNTVAARAEAAASGPPAAQEVLAVAPGGEHVLEEHFDDEVAELAARQPCFAVIRAGSAVALCQGARPLGGAETGLQPCRATEASVRTAPAHRGRGYAPRVVAAWASEVARRGGCPLYSTSWENRPSRAVARKLGLLCFGDDVHLR